MKRSPRSHYFLPLSLFADTLCMNLAFFLSFVVRFRTLHSILEGDQLNFFLFFNTTWFMLLLIVKPYSESRISFNIAKLLYNLVILLLIHASLIALFWVFSKGYTFSRIRLVLIYFFALAIGGAIRVIGVLILRYLRIKGYNVRNFVVVGYGSLSHIIVDYYNSHLEMGYSFHGFFGDSGSSNSRLNKSVSILPFNKIQDYIQSNNIDYIYCCIPYLNKNQISKLITLSQSSNSRIKVVFDFTSFAKNGLSIEYHGFLPILNVSPKPHSDARTYFIRRSFDIAFSASVLILGFPFFIVLVLITKLSSPGPVFYKSERVGIWGSKFMMYKFRSMNTEASKRKNIVLTTVNDPRITKWGKFMRETRIDELPQFINVLKGEMSIVGPRPGIPSYNKAVMEIAPEFKKLLGIKPGITSFGQINYGYAETPEEMVQRMKFDMLHLKEKSLLTDLWLIYKTALNMLFFRGK
ncbi:MAG: exopolysaccharide biosynthesis polyprenyl glycosylphosphotransferase [Salibacteraceae bacterium]|jgi:exopolysaccharide biosynthesis polyprenyl glycosylphosphotransferase